MYIYNLGSCKYLTYTHVSKYRNQKDFLQNNVTMKKNHFPTIDPTKNYGAASTTAKTTR